MNQLTRHQMKKVVEQWRRAGPELERVRKEELRRWQYDHKAVDALLDMGDNFGKSRPTSGLVEMQKWFMKLAGRRGLRPLSVRERKADYNRSKKPDKGRAPHEKV
ncbi:MAG: hypothetical protein WC381_02250 [Kiritimatiellia bacterium]